MLIYLSRARYFRMALKGLLIGLIMPALVLLGVALGLMVGRDPLMRMLLALLGGLTGLIVSTLALIKVYEKLYPPGGQ